MAEQEKCSQLPLCSWQLPVPLLHTDTAWLQADVKWLSGFLQACLGVWRRNVLDFGGGLASQTHHRISVLSLEPAEF